MEGTADRRRVQLAEEGQRSHLLAREPSDANVSGQIVNIFFFPLLPLNPDTFEMQMLFFQPNARSKSVMCSFHFDLCPQNTVKVFSRPLNERVMHLFQLVNLF